MIKMDFMSIAKSMVIHIIKNILRLFNWNLCNITIRFIEV